MHVLPHRWCNGWKPDPLGHNAKAIKKGLKALPIVREKAFMALNFVYAGIAGSGLLAPATFSYRRSIRQIQGKYLLRIDNTGNRLPNIPAARAQARRPTAYPNFWPLDPRFISD
jgi:hypothetical protein